MSNKWKAIGLHDDATAEVGQTIRVKAVDENNLPIEWETVDTPDKLSDFENDLFYNKKTSFLTLNKSDFQEWVAPDGFILYLYTGSPKIDWATSKKDIAFTFSYTIDGETYTSDSESEDGHFDAFTTDDGESAWEYQADGFSICNGFDFTIFDRRLSKDEYTIMLFFDSEMFAAITDLNIEIFHIDKKSIDYDVLPEPAGKNVTGTEYTINDITITADEGAEVFNDYKNNIASGAYSHAEGVETIASGNYSHAEGVVTTASGMNSHAEGGGTTASGNDSHSEGNGTTASGSRSHAEGSESKVTSDSSATASTTNLAYKGYAGHAEGHGTISYGRCSHAEGNGTTASGNDSHSEGNGTTASGSYGSHAEGWKTTASGSHSHAEGESTTASGVTSHAEGYKTIASAFYSHAEGDSTVASVDSSHAEGIKTKVTGDSSVTAPNATQNGLNGYAGHAEGYGTISYGRCSHAEGNATTASGDDSHAEGVKTIAAGECQHVQGKYNIEDADDACSHIVGNGESNDARSNAHTLDWDGNAWFAGDVYVGSTSGTNKDEGSVKLIRSPATATVGQTIRVSAVDENGVPTAWEAVDMMSTDGLASTEYVDEQVAAKQDTLTGADGQIVGFDADGNVIAIDLPSQDYNDLTSKPTINGIELSGNKTNADLGIADPTDEQVTTAVNAWLDEHPEATTTVEDGSVTGEKIHDAVIYHQVFDLDDLLANYTLNSGNDAFIISPHWEVEPETLYTMNFYGTYTRAFTCYNENKVSLGSTAVDGTTFQFTTLANTKYITFQSYIGSDKSKIATEYANAMICKGDTLYTDFFVGKKYILSDLLLREMLSQLAEGVVDGAKITPKTIEKNRLTPDFQIIPDEIKGINLKNLFNANDYAYSAEDTDNVKVGYPGSYGNVSWRTLIVPCKPNTTYYLYLHNGTEAVEVSSYMRSSIRCYDANLEEIGSVALTDFAFTTPENTAFILPWFLAQSESVFNSVVSTMMLTTWGVTDRYYPYTAEPEWLNLMAKKGTEELSVLCYGDSLTSGKYPSRVADLLGCKVVDAGVGGNTCAGIADRVGNYGTDFDVVTLMVGTNDNGGQTSCPLGTADDEAATDDNATAAETTYASRLKRLLNKIKSTHRGATFVIMPPFEHTWSDYSALVPLMEEIARKYKMPFLDIYHLCGWDGTDAEDAAIFMADGTHENDLGAQRIAELLAGFIKQLKGA